MSPARYYGWLLLAHLLFVTAVLVASALFDSRIEIWSGNMVYGEQLSLLSIWGTLGLLVRDHSDPELLTLGILVSLANGAVLSVVRWKWLTPQRFSLDRLPAVLAVSIFRPLDYDRYDVDCRDAFCLPIGVLAQRLSVDHLSDSQSTQR